MVGYTEERQAGNAIDALNAKLAINARVTRGGEWINPPAQTHRSPPRVRTPTSLPRQDQMANRLRTTSNTLNAATAGTAPNSPASRAPEPVAGMVYSPTTDCRVVNREKGRAGKRGPCALLLDLKRGQNLGGVQLMR
jgi:hypothetical protein